MADQSIKAPSEYPLIGPSDDGKINDLLKTLNAKDGRQRLQALIAEWLRMENLVVLAGAGTSVTSGGKTMVNLERDVLATIKLLPNLPASISALIDARIAPKSDGSSKIGFEDWLSYLVNAGFIGSAPSSPFSGVQWRGAVSPTQEELSSFIAQIGKAIFAECALTLPDTDKSAAVTEDIAPHLAFCRSS